MNWFLPLLAFVSLSIRTPNVQPNPLDYQYSLGVEKVDQLYFNRVWERELGQYYIDEEYWIQKKFKVGGSKILLKDKYLNITSKNIQYNQSELRFVYDDMSVGYALRYINNNYSHRIIAGWEIDKRFNIFLINGQFTIRTELTSNIKVIDYSIYSKMKFGLLKNLDIYFLLQSEKVGNINNFQVKGGLEIELIPFKTED